MPEPPDPTDVQITARLDGQPATLWEELFATADALTADDLQVGGADHPVYSERVQAIQDLLTRLGVVFPFDWMAWPGARRYPGGRGLAEAPVADAARLATVIVRGERFADGTVAAALADGAFLAVLERLRAWYLEKMTWGRPSGG